MVFSRLFCLFVLVLLKLINKFYNSKNLNDKKVPTVLNPMFIQNAQLGDHNICFYTSPQEKQNLLFSNLKAGLDQGCSAVYVASEEDIERIKFEMRKFGLELDDPKKLTILTIKQLYTPDGEFRVSRVMEKVRSVLDESLDWGFEGVYASGDVSRIFDQFTKNGMVEEWLAYEKAVGRTFKFPFSAMCAYNIEQVRLNDPAFLQLIQAHKNTVTAKNFIDNEKICVDAITGELHRTLGEGATKLIISYLEERLNSPHNQILAEIGDFNQSLKSILGNGATTLETQILKKLYEKIEQ